MLSSGLMFALFAYTKSVFQNRFTVQFQSMSIWDAKNMCKIILCGCMFEKGTELHYLQQTSRWHCASQYRPDSLLHFLCFLFMSMLCTCGFTIYVVHHSVFRTCHPVNQMAQEHRNTNQIAWVETMTGPFLPKPVSCVPLIFVSLQPKCNQSPRYI